MFAMTSRREYGETRSVLADWNIGDNQFYLFNTKKFKGDERAFVVLVFNVCAHGEGMQYICSRSQGAGRPPSAETGDVAMSTRAKQEKRHRGIWCTNSSAATSFTDVQ